MSPFFTAKIALNGVKNASKPALMASFLGHKLAQILGFTPRQILGHKQTQTLSPKIAPFLSLNPEKILTKMPLNTLIASHSHSPSAPQNLPFYRTAFMSAKNKTSTHFDAKNIDKNAKNSPKIAPLNAILITAIGFYQRFISPALPRSCRFYPSCSAFAMQHFLYSGFFRALGAVLCRLARCNQAFRGGTDYPIIRAKMCGLPCGVAKNASLKLPRKNSPITTQKISKIAFWLVPLDTKSSQNHFYLVKSFKD